MPPASPRLDAVPDRRTRRYTWLLALVVAIGLGGSLAISYTLYRTAERQWIAHADSAAQRLSSTLLSWLEESYSPLSALAALVENSRKTEPEEFLNAFEGIESRVTTVLLGSAAMLERDTKGRWVLSISSGDFDFLTKDRKNGFSTLRPAIEFAMARPNQFVLAPPVQSAGSRLMAPVLIAPAKVKTPTVLVGRLEYTTLRDALVGAPTPKGFYLTLKGKFMGTPGMRTVIQIDPPQPLVRKLTTRAATAGADLEIIWGLTKEYENGPDYGVAAVTLAGGITTTLIFGMFMLGLIRRNRVINEKVDEATAALRRSSEEQTAILESATAGIAFVKDRVIVRGNARLDELFGFGHGEQIGRPTRIWYPDDDSHAAGGAGVYEQIARGETHQRVQQLVRNGGELFWCRLSGRAVDVGDLSQGTVWILEDVTQEKAAEEALRQAKEMAEDATQMKSMFLANMSHEIRTPMNAIIGLSHLALKTDLTPKQRDYVGKVHNAGTSLLGLINDILDFSKIEAGRLDLETIEFEMDEVMSSIVTLSGQKASEKGLELLVDVPRTVPQRLVGDPLRLGQIITNLVNNAVKFTERGEIRVNAELLGQTADKVELRFSVQDTGMGLTPDQAAKLFRPFTQADMSTTRKHGGTGLGLTISRSLAEAMGGQMWLNSEVGIGSTFFFTVWLGIGAARASGKILPERLPRLNVLVVDDNAAAREILLEALSGVTAHADAVSSGAEAVAAVKQHDEASPYDLVFMDWRMPSMDGLEATRRIKEDQQLRRPPAVVMVTAFGREEVRDEAERLGIDGFLVKPVTKSMLVDTLITLFAPPAEETGRAAASGDEHAGRLSGARILLAEDNDINQQIAVELLEGVGARMKVANNGREAVEALMQDPNGYDLVLMDLQMPEMDGFQATARIRAERRFANLPIIAMTAHATVEERQRCLAAGMNDHISKPIDPNALFTTVGHYFQPPVEGRSDRDAAPPSQPPRVSSTDDRPLPSVEGLDTADGLLRIGGNRKLYLKLLRQFVEQQSDAPARIAECLMAGDHATAERLAHTVKGVAGNLGAGAVQTAAGELEKAIRSRDEAAQIEALRERVATQLDALIGRLRPELAREPVPDTGGESPAATVDPEELKTVVADMGKQLSEFDPAAADTLEANRGVFRHLLSADDFALFEQHVQDYAFGEAQALLEQAVKARSL
jgi:PAS domain S-box-containing protein